MRVISPVEASPAGCQHFKSSAELQPAPRLSFLGIPYCSLASTVFPTSVRMGHLSLFCIHTMPSFPRSTYLHLTYRRRIPSPHFILHTPQVFQGSLMCRILLVMHLLGLYALVFVSKTSPGHIVLVICSMSPRAPRFMAAEALFHKREIQFRDTLITVAGTFSQRTQPVSRTHKGQQV